MSIEKTIRLGFQLPKSDDLVLLENRLAAVNKAGQDAALALARQEIGYEQYRAQVRELNAEASVLRPAIAALTSAYEAALEAEERQAAARAQSLQSERDWIQAMGASARAARDKAKAIAESDRSHKDDQQLLAAQHETEMLRHEEEQLRALKAAEDAELASLERSVAETLAAANATEALTTSRKADAFALAKETDFERLDASAKHQEAEAARELAQAEEMAALAAGHESQVLGKGVPITDAAAAAMGKLAAAMGRGEIDANQYDAAVARINKDNDRLVQTHGGVAAASAKTAGSNRNLGLGFLELSRAVEDAQYGLNGVLNNLPSMISMFGGPAGLAAVVSLTAVGAYSLRHELSALNDYLNDRPWITMADSVGTLKKRLEELTDKPHKLDLDYSRIDEATKMLEGMEKRLAAFKAIGDQSSNQEKSGKAVSDLIREEAGGTDEVSGKENLAKLLAASGGIDEQDAIAGSKTKQGALIRAAQAELDRLKSMKPADLEEAAAIGNRINTVTERIAELKHDMTAIMKEKAEEIIGGAARGIEADRKRIAQIFDRNRGLFEQGDAARGLAPVSPIFRQALEESSPDAIKRQTDEEHNEQIEQERRRDADARRAIRNEVQKKAAAELKEKQRNALAEIKANDAQDPFDDAAAKWANASSKDLEEAFAKAKAKIAEALTRKLEDKKVSTVGAEDLINDAATTLADQAFTRVGRLQTRAAKAQAKNAKFNEEQAKKENKPFLEAEDRSIERGGYVPMAENALALARAQGGATDQYGRFHRLDKDQQFELVRRQVEAELKQRNPGMSADQRGDVAMKITASANKNYESHLGDAMNRSLNAHIATQQVLAETQANLAAVMARLSAVESNNGQLRSQNRQQRRQATSSPTAQNFGRPN